MSMHNNDLVSCNFDQMFTVFGESTVPLVGGRQGGGKLPVLVLQPLHGGQLKRGGHKVDNQ